MTGSGKRQFKSGANRDSDEGKLDYEAYFSPLVLQARAEYMKSKQRLADGTLRAGDNWQKGFGSDGLGRENRTTLFKSAWRHFMDIWLWHRGHSIKETIVEALCALLFNIEGFLHDVLITKGK